MAISQNPWQSIMSRLPGPLRNRYYLVTVLFIFYLVFIDKHDLLTQFKLRRSLNRLENDRVFYEDQIKKAAEEAEDFDLTKERYAREHYYMRQNDEDVFIIQKEK